MQTTKNPDSVTHKSKSQIPALLGQQVPGFFVQATDHFDIDFQSLTGYQTLLVFYPQNGLPGVTQLAKDLKSQYSAFKKINTCIFGISIESLEANQAFKDAQSLPFQLISDSEFALANWSQTLTERTLFGEPIKSLEQTTILVDANGTVTKIWRSPDIRGHARSVFQVANKQATGIDIRLEDDSTPLIGEGQEQLAAELAALFEH